MNKKFLSAILFGALAVASTGSFVSCKDYDDDIKNLQTQIGQLANKQDLQSQVSTLQSAISTAQSAAENKAAAAQKAADDAKAAAEAAAAKAAAATTEAEKAAADAAAAKAAADAAAAAADLKAAEEKIAALQTSLSEVEALAATLVKTEDFEAAKKELNDKVAALDAKVAQATGTAGLTGLQVLAPETIAVGYGVWDGVHEGAKAATWDGPKAEEAAALTKGTYVSAFGTKALEIAVNPTDINIDNAEFAVVNKYGDVAPIAFGAPKVLTRANAAGSYTIQLKSAATTSEAVKTFNEKFDGAGANAALVAGKVAAKYTPGFITIEQAKNATKSAFGAEVKYDEISGSVDLVAAKPENVFDAYIVKLDGVTEHDSLLWKLKYDGLTLTYSADAAKALAAKDIKVIVKQINLNGYIHSGSATVKFLGKETAKPIEKDVVLGDHTHAVQVLSKNTKTDEDLQVVKVTKAEMLEALGYTKGSEEYIHFDHSTLQSGISIVDAYYYGVDNDTVGLNKNFAAVSLVDGAIVLNFAPRAAVEGVSPAYKAYDKKLLTGTDKVDVVAKSKKMYATLKVKAVDNKDIEGAVTTEYTVTLPIKFQWVDVETLYTWNQADYLPTNIKAAITEKPGFQYTEGKFTAVTDADDNPLYYAPSMAAVLDVDNNKNYKLALAAIEDRDITSTYTKKMKEADKALLKEQFLTLVSVNDVEYVYATEDTPGYNQWSGDVAPTLENKINSVVVGNEDVDYTLGSKYSYTITGLKGKVLDRTVSLVNRTINVTDAEDPTPASLTTEAALSMKNTLLTNTAYTAAATVQQNGTFTFTAEEDAKTLALTANSAITILSIKWLDAEEKEIEASEIPATASIEMKTFEYSYANADDVTGKARGIQIIKTDAPEDAVKVVVEYTVSNAVYAATSASAGTQTVKTTFNL